MMQPRRSQCGLAAAAVIIAVILGVVVLLLARGYFGSEANLDQRGVTDANLRRIADALAQFASLNQRLPCPAAGTSDAGTEDATSPFSTCNSPGGVVPWAALALRRSDTLDGWGRKISYRVLSGSTGLTQTGGTSMTDCNTNATAAATSSGLTSGKCPATHYVSPAVFLAGKGLSVQTDSATTGGYAYVLVSHGESGSGAFGAEGTARSTLPASTALEYRNTQPGTTFDSRSRSAPGIATTDATYFDDIVLAVSITDVVNAAKLTARDWGDVSGSLLAASTATAPTFARSDVAAALGFTPSYNTGRNTINFGAFTVTAYGSTARNVSSGIGTSGQGIGSIGTGSNTASTATISSASNEFLRFDFTSNQLRYLGITLVDFGILFGSDPERARFRFFQGATLVSQIDKPGCRSINSGNVEANFLLDPGTTFDRLEVAARTSTFGFANSTFLVGGLRACTDLLGANTCTASGANSADDCP